MTPQSNIYAVILAGGEGTRFHPFSTPERPKQFLNIVGGRSFLRHTYERIAPLSSSSRIYIAAGEAIPDISCGAFRVKAFVEKPDMPTARRYLNEGTYSWNSGMFVWCVRDILDEIARYLPALHTLLDSFDNGRDYCARFFDAAPAISIDYGVMEKSRRVAVIPCDIGWSDVGTWEGLYRLYADRAVTLSPEAVGVMQQVLGQESRGENDCHVLEVSTAELDDVVRIADDYGRSVERS
ncbi:MAG: sugar phosphate nucleotidyltransferase [bacterium]